VHAGAFEQISSSLAAMMRNGMKESEEGEASLDHVEVGTFKRLVEYACTGKYRISRSEPVSIGAFCCVKCGTIVYNEDVRAHLVCPDCEGEGTIINESSTRYCLCCGRHGPDPTWFRCGNCNIMVGAQKNISSWYKNQIKAETASTEPVLVDSSINSNFPVGEYSQKDFTAVIDHSSPRLGWSDLVSEHAKLYMCADMYLVDELKQMCLHRLHRDLRLVNVNPKSIEEVVNLISYTYRSTRRTSDDTEPVGEGLRDLV
jgi:hypothetical protein